MDKQSKKIIGLFARYFLVLLAGLGNLYLIYKILTPLTVYTVNAILSIFTKTILIENTIYLTNVVIEIIPACVAGAAFYLLLLLVFSTSDIGPKIRTKAIILAFAIFFILNITRILILVPIIEQPYYDAVHWIFWHIVSTAMVVAIWFGIIKFYKIKSIPVYSDLKYMKGLIYPHKNSKRKKKNK